MLVYGNGRLESAKKLGWEKIRADVKEGLTESQKLHDDAGGERRKGSASHFLHTLAYTMKLMETEHLTQEQLANKLGRGLELKFENYARIARMAPEVAMNPHCPVGGVSYKQCLTDRQADQS